MLAAVDDRASDDESTGPIDTKALFAAIDKTKQKLGLEQTSKTTVQTNRKMRRPRLSGLGAELLPECMPTSQKPIKPPSPSSPPGLARQDGTPRPISEQDLLARGSSLTGEEDEEDDIVAPSRRRLARPNRRSTPEATVPVDRHSSPSLFVSPSPHKSAATNHDSPASGSDDDDVPIDLSKDARFKALVEKKRKERLEREAEEERKRVERAQRVGERAPAESDADEDDVSDISDDDGGRKLTQDISRPTRKASKKALEEMNRETQRLSRSLQLAHEAKTKKKISKDMLFKRFNFRAEGSTADTENKQTSSSRPTTPGSVHQTDAELEDNGTPPSSPPSAPKVIPDPPTTTVPISESSIPMPEMRTVTFLL